MEIMKFIMGPLVGGTIGLCTNYLAIKMLFRPYNEIKFLGIKMPFTPGLIPKRKGDIAKVIGRIVNDDLLDKNELKKYLLSDELKIKFGNSIIKKLQENGESIKNNIIKIFDEEEYCLVKDKICNLITLKIKDEVIKMNIGSIIANEGAKAVKDSITNPLFKMFINENTIAGFAEPIGEKIEEYIKKNSETLIGNSVRKEFENLENQNVNELLEKYSIDESKLQNIFNSIYETILLEKIDEILVGFDVSKIIEDKINQMDMKELEKLILKIMKKELNAIVYLGGVLGFLIGFVNILF